MRVWNTVGTDRRDAVSVMESALRHRGTGSDLPRFVGWLSFSAGRRFDSGFARRPAPPDPLREAQMRFGDFPAVVELNFDRKETRVLDRRGARATHRLARHVEVLLSDPFVSLTGRSAGSRRPSPVRFSVPSEKKFARMVVQAQKAIRAGDIYQANLSLRFSARFDHDPVTLFRALSERNPSPYAMLVRWGGRTVVSCSPELLLRARGGRVATRPIAGTRPRGADSSADRRRQGQLLLSPKERAEHVMLVDLERNDLGRVCRPGSVSVPERYQIERYSHVMHIVSEVRGRLSRGKTSIDALRALFPGGTITGCPKIRSTELIEKIEGVARGPFYGSAGFVADNGDAVFNILIRTAFLENGRIHIQAGAGIVADSRADREYREVLQKARVLLETASTLS